MKKSKTLKSHLFSIVFFPLFVVSVAMRIKNIDETLNEILEVLCLIIIIEKVSKKYVITLKLNITEETKVKNLLKRLKNIDEKRKYFAEEINLNELISKKLKNVCKTLTYIKHLPNRQLRPCNVAGTSQMKHPTTSRWNVVKTSQWYVSTTSYWNVVTTSQEDVTTTSHQYVFTTSQAILKRNTH